MCKQNSSIFWNFKFPLGDVLSKFDALVISIHLFHIYEKRLLFTDIIVPNPWCSGHLEFNSTLSRFLPVIIYSNIGGKDRYKVDSLSSTRKIKRMLTVFNLCWHNLQKLICKRKIKDTTFPFYKCRIKEFKPENCPKWSLFSTYEMLIYFIVIWLPYQNEKQLRVLTLKNNSNARLPLIQTIKHNSHCQKTNIHLMTFFHFNKAGCELLSKR